MGILRCLTVCANIPCDAGLETRSSQLEAQEMNWQSTYPVTVAILDGARVLIDDSRVAAGVSQPDEVCRRVARLSNCKRRSYFKKGQVRETSPE